MVELSGTHIFLQVLGWIAQDFTVQVPTPVDVLNAFLDIFVYVGTVEVQLLVHEVLYNIRQQAYLHPPPTSRSRISSLYSSQKSFIRTLRYSKGKNQ
jgi:hypothetical protein